MYKKILVPVDGSDTATAGLQEAIKLAKDQGARIRLVHVVDELILLSTQASGIVMDDLVAHMQAAGKAVLAIAQALVHDAGIEADTRLVEAYGGRAGEHILNAALEWPADLIVCGTHGRRGVRRIVLGSDAEYIVRHSPMPVLLIRAVEPATHTSLAA